MILTNRGLEYQLIKYIDYGFLAANAEKAASTLLDHKRPLTEEECSSLKSGSEFLKQVAAGAQILNSGNYHVQNLKTAVEAFEFVIDPLEQLGALLSQSDIAQALDQAANTVLSKLNQPSTIEFTTDDQTNISLFQKFYDSFYVFICEQMALVNQEPLLGDKSRFDITSAVA